MSRSSLRRFGVVLLAAVMTVTGLVAPSHAATATGTITGQLTDHGAPFTEANVYLEGYDVDFWRSAWLDEEGRYTFDDVPVGSYVVQFSPWNGPTQYAYGTIDWEEAAIITVTAGGTTVVNDELLPTGTITGRLVDSSGNPVPWAWVSARTLNWSGRGAGPTNGNGEFTFAVTPGDYIVEFNVEGLEQFAYGAINESDATVFTVTAGSTTVVNDQLLPTGRITGRFADRAGTPISGVAVSAVRADGSSVGYGYTDWNGMYIMDVLPGQYLVRFQAGNIEQYAYGALREADARLFTVVADASITVNDRLVATGAIAGRFTDAAGVGMYDVQVTAAGEGFHASTTTDGEGYYQFDSVPVGSHYEVEFSHWQEGFSQYAYGALTSADAARIEVRTGETTTVDDSRLPTGSVRITAIDAKTGEQIKEFDAGIREQYADTTDGVVVLPEVPVGTHNVHVWSSGYSTQPVTVTVTAGEQAAIEVPLQPLARMRATIVDSLTGAPVSGVCVVPVRVTEVLMQDGCGQVSDEFGRIDTSVYGADGDYKLLAWPSEAEGYGAQWVGEHGGTGDLRRAATVSFAPGESTSAPVIRMDKAGVITGRVFAPDNSPLSHGGVRIAGEPVGLGGGFGAFHINADGYYRIDKFGPYEWPLLFDVYGYAYQWSGGKGNRHQAETVLVRAGETTVYDYRLDAGVAVTLKTSSLQGTYVVAVHAETGDITGVWSMTEAGVGITRQVIGGQDVKFYYYPYSGRAFVGGSDLASATTYEVPKRKNVTIELPI